MDKDLVKIIMNPVRQRIAQYLLIHKTGTTGEIKEELNDVPPASLYRHMKVLLNAGLIEVVEEKKVRGTIEKTYGLVEKPLGDCNQEDISALIQTSILSILSSFQKYFTKQDVDPQKDLLSVSTSTLLLSDQELMEMFQKIGKIYNEVIANKPNKDRKPRRLTFISSPCEDDN